MEKLAKCLVLREIFLFFPLPECVRLQQLSRYCYDTVLPFTIYFYGRSEPIYFASETRVYENQLSTLRDPAQWAIVPQIMFF